MGQSFARLKVMDYLVHLAILLSIYLILAQSFNLTFGLGRLFNVAHVAAYAIGAYTTALLSVDLGQNFFSCVISSMALSACFALLIGAIAIKLTHDYFAIGTLAFSSVVTAVLINWRSLTRGVLGIPGIPRPEIFGMDFSENNNFLALIVTVALLSNVFLYLLFRSSFARKLRMQAESPVSAESLGVFLKTTRNDCFIISSMFAGLAGSMYAYYINYIDPSSFNLHEMVFLISIVVVGKPGSFWGVTLATAFLVLLPEPLRFVALPPGILGPARQMLYATILFSVVYWKRHTLFPLQREI